MDKPFLHGREKFNRPFGLKLTHHDINYICNCCNTVSSSYYIKVHRGWLRQIFCLPDSNKNSQKEFLKGTRSWHIEEISCLASSNKPSLEIQGVVAYPFSFSFFYSNIRCFILILLSLIFGVQILKTLSRTWILLKCKTSTRFYDLMFTSTIIFTSHLKKL